MGRRRALSEDGERQLALLVDAGVRQEVAGRVLGVSRRTVVRVLGRQRDAHRELSLAELVDQAELDLAAPLFPDLDEAALRTAIEKACKATATPHFSPHGLRRRRGSLYYKRTGSLAEVAELLGDSKRVAADHYVYAMVDYREVDPTIALARLIA
jgi:integrase